MSLRMGIQTSTYLLGLGDLFEYAGEPDCSDMSGKNHLDSTAPIIRNLKASSQLKTVILCYIYPIGHLYISIVPRME